MKRTRTRRKQATRQSQEPRLKRELRNMGIKDAILYTTAIIAFLAGLALVFLSFFTPPKGIIDNSIVFVAGQSLVFTATVLGIGQHYKNELNKFKASVNSELALKERLKEIDLTDDSQDDYDDYEQMLRDYDTDER